MKDNPTLDQIFWLNRDGSKKLITDMSAEELQETLQTIQIRQVEALSKLEMSFRLEEAVRDKAKREKITLIELDNSNCKKDYTKEKFAKIKERIKSVNRNIKLKLKSHVTTNQVLLQKS